MYSSTLVDNSLTLFKDHFNMLFFLFFLFNKGTLLLQLQEEQNIYKGQQEQYHISMGAKLSLLAQTSPSIGIFSYIDILDEVHYISQLNSSKFLKTCKAIDPNGEIIIKVFLKPNEEFELSSVISQIEKQQLLLSQLPSVLNYSKIINSNRAIYLIRQHLKGNLYDRLSSRPYLHPIELKFITFQLLQSIQEIHNLGMAHGDLKTENILINSWNWIVLTDFASLIKPVYLPEDNPSEFSFYFDTAKRRSCYVAPERFNSKLHDKNTATDGSQFKVTQEMDIFSAGCCIAELFLEGVPLFNLSQLFKYKNNEFEVKQYLMENLAGFGNKTDENTHESVNASTISNEDIKLLCYLIMDMIDIDPTKRLSCRDLLNKYRGTFFPESFYIFTYDYFKTLTVLSTNIPRNGELNTPYTLKDSINVVDNCIKKIYLDFDKICNELKLPLSHRPNKPAKTNGYYHNYITWYDGACIELKFNKYYNDIPAVKDECALLFLSYLLHSLRCCKLETTQIKCLELITSLSQFISDENKIDRVIPFLVTCIMNHAFPDVQALALQNICQILSTVEVLTPLNENIFIDYLFPKIKKLFHQCNTNNNQYVKIVLANCLGDLVTTAERFQELNSIKYIQSQNQLLQGFTNLNISTHSSRKLLQYVDDLTIGLLTDNNVAVKISLLKNILPLCTFFGKERTNDVILSHLITYLNDRNYLLRMTLVETIPSVAILLGPITLEQYILPLLIQSLVDSEECVIISVLSGLKNLCKIGLTSKSVFYDLAFTVCPLVLHPNYSIRHVTIQLIYEISQQLTKAEIYCKLYPIVRSYFGFDVEFSLDLLIESCKQPVSRTIFNLLCSWSLHSLNSLFWKQVDSNETDIFGNKIIIFIDKDYVPTSYRSKELLNIAKTQKKASIRNYITSFDNREVPLTTEDKLWVDKFIATGTQERDLWKLEALRSYVVRYTKTWNQYSNKTAKTNSTQQYQQQNGFESSNIVPRNIFFDIKFATPEKRPQSAQSGEIPKALDFKTKEFDTLQMNGRSIIPNLMNLNGSLLFQSHPLATTTSDLRNVYVQFDTKRKHEERVSSDENLTRYNDPDRYIVEDSYEGNVTTIRKFIQNCNILPSLKEYKEFGSQSNLERGYLDFQNQQDEFIASLAENRHDQITAMVLSSDKHPFLLTGSLHGLIYLWDIPGVVSGFNIQSSLKYDCGAPITHMELIPGFDTVIVSLKTGTILCLRVLSKLRDEVKIFTKLTRIRELNINDIEVPNSTASSYDNYAVQFKVCMNNDTSMIVVLTNTSKVLLIDIRNMKFLKCITNPNEHGAISSFDVNPLDMTLILGTMKGIVDIWDLRFTILVNSFTFGNHTPITTINLIKHVGPSHIVVVGGASEVLFTVWDYSKMVCKFGATIGAETPSISKFTAITTNLDNIRPQIDETESKISTITVRGGSVITAQYDTPDILVFDILCPSNSSILFKTALRNHAFVPFQATANLLFIQVKPSGTRSVIQRIPILRDTVNNIVLGQIEDKSFLFAGTTQNVINIYK